MKTGMVRKIDELGRIVIPKEIRRNLKLNMGDVVEIYVEDNKIIFKRFSTLLGLEEDLFNIAKVINEQNGATILFVDQDKIIVGYGKLSENYLDKEILREIYEKSHETFFNKYKGISLVEDYIEDRQIYITSLHSKKIIHGLFIAIENEHHVEQKDLDIMLQFKKFICKQLDS